MIRLNQLVCMMLLISNFIHSKTYILKKKAFFEIPENTYLDLYKTKKNKFGHILRKNLCAIDRLDGKKTLYKFWLRENGTRAIQYSSGKVDFFLETVKTSYELLPTHLSKGSTTNQRSKRSVKKTNGAKKGIFFVSESLSRSSSDTPLPYMKFYEKHLKDKNIDNFLSNINNQDFYYYELEYMADGRINLLVQSADRSKSYSLRSDLCE